MFSEFKQSDTYIELKAELENFVPHDLSPSIDYRNFFALRRESNKRDDAFTKTFLYKASVPEEFTKRGCKKAARQAVKNKITAYRDYFTPDKSENIAEEIGKMYSKAICDKLRKCKDKIIAWHQTENVVLPQVTINLSCHEDLYVYIPLKASENISTDMDEIIEEYINRRILPKCNYGKNLHVWDFKISYQKRELIENLKIYLPFLIEKFKKLTGNYYAWNYEINFDSDLDFYCKASEEACMCAQDFFKTGYIQKIGASLAKEFIEKIENPDGKMHDQFAEFCAQVGGI